MIFLCRHHLSNRPRPCPFALCSVLCRTDSGRVDYLAWRHPVADFFPNPVPSDFPGRSFLVAIPCSIARSNLLCCHHYHLGFARFSLVLVGARRFECRRRLFVLPFAPGRLLVAVPRPQARSPPGRASRDCPFVLPSFAVPRFLFLTPGPAPVFLRERFLGCHTSAPGARIFFPPLGSPGWAAISCRKARSGS